MPRLSKIGAAALAAFGWSSGSAGVTASYLVVAGGGGGGNADGNSNGGGGGAGGLLTGTASLNPTLTYTITVGAGGPAATSGSNSVFNSFTSIGGGRGGTLGGAGANGGSGGGAGGNDIGSQSGGTGTAGQGNNGGACVNAYQGGGGGGASAAGSASNVSSGAGGAGTASSITGTSVTYAGGGGGNGGAGGSGGGGAGGGTPVAGTANLGGGGGGKNGSGTAAAGGSGVVIISYAGAQQFGGGVVTSVGGNTIHTFNTSGVLSPITSLSASYLVIAGGGGGGADGAGGGGAGGLLSGSGVTIDTNSNYLVTVGAGGAGGVYPSVSAAVAGGNSSFSMVTTTAVGGGIGSQTSGGNGGSGGGGRGNNTNPGGTGTVGQGNNGGSGSSGNASGAGGGAGAVGANGSSTGGAGGIGVTSSISGTSTYYAGGGGGGNPGLGTGLGGAGGLGGGGSGNSEPGGSGTANTGGGGGGETGSATGTRAGGNGGSGVVIISYAGATQLMAGGTVTIAGGNVIHTFTSSGYLTPIKLVNRSLRFRSSASAYLNRTPASSGNQQKFTFSHWFKRGTLSTQQVMFGLNSASTNIFTIAFLSGDTFRVFGRNAGTDVLNLTTTAVFRDPAAWYHIVVAIDTTQSTSSNRAIVYINGVQVTAFGTSTYPSQNTSLAWNSSSYSHQIGREDTGNYVDGYLTEINFIDGQALTPNSFGTINSYGVWQPITYGGSYGTNGFYLPFTNNASTTTLGYDFSPNGNNWTTNNISLTAGTTYDSMTDVPTLTSATASNYAVLNPLSLVGNTFSEANLKITSATNTKSAGTIALPATGKWYWECVWITNGGGSNPQFGLVSQVATATSANDNLWYRADGDKYDQTNTASAYGATWTTNDVIGVAVDMDAGTLTFYKNNTSQGIAFSTITTRLSGNIFPSVKGNAAGDVQVINFGQRPFTYTPPSGFVALNTYNL